MKEPTRAITTKAVRYGSKRVTIITNEVAASLPNRQTEGLLGVKVRLSSGESRFRTEGSYAIVYNVPKKLRGESAASNQRFAERLFFRRMCCLPLVFFCHSGNSRLSVS